VREIPPLSLTPWVSTCSPEDRIPIVRIQRPSDLSAAQASVRAGVVKAGLPSQNEIALEDWVFHPSLVYYAGEWWSEVEAAARSISATSATCFVNDVELLGFDGGPVRLLGRCPLLGSP
jgi:hypothetical protein